MSKKVLVPIADGTEEIEAVCLIDTLRRAGAEVMVASVTAARTVTCSRGVRIEADVLIAACADVTYDLIAVPGGMPGAEHLRDNAVLTDLLKQQRDAGRLYAAICAAPVVVLQHHGLLAGRRATCFPGFAAQLHNAEAAGERVVVDGNCVTSRGAGSAIEFALALITLLYDADTSAEVGARMQVQ